MNEEPIFIFDPGDGAGHRWFTEGLNPPAGARPAPLDIAALANVLLDLDRLHLLGTTGAEVVRKRLVEALAKEGDAFDEQGRAVGALERRAV